MSKHPFSWWSFGDPIKDTREKSPSSYFGGGWWPGYSFFRRKSIDGKYVDQMTNALAGKYKILTEKSGSWMIDIEKKKLWYSTNTGLETKGEVVASILHEVGHIVHTPSDASRGSFALPMYRKYRQHGADLLFLCVEDKRVDSIMEREYAGAHDLFEENRHIVEELAKTYAQKVSYEDIATIYDYCSEILKVLYRIDRKEVKKEIAPYVQSTEDAIIRASNASSGKEALEILEKDVFPVVENLFLAPEDREETKNQQGEKHQEEILKILQATADEVLGDTITARKTSRFFAAGIEGSPYVTYEDYASLYDSIASYVHELSRKLVFLKRKENIPLETRIQKRGSIDIKRAVHARTRGETRVFKRKTDQDKKISSFAFALLVDTSGSMSGKNIEEAKRGTALVAEVLKKAGIPFEITLFSGKHIRIKGFDEIYGNRQKSKVSGMSASGGTSIRGAILKSELKHQPQKNKFYLILTDGAISDIQEAQEAIGTLRNRRHRVFSCVFVIDRRQITSFDSVRNIKNADEIVDSFSGLIRETFGMKQRTMRNAQRTH